MDAFGNPLMQSNDFELHDFIYDPNFDQFVDLIRGENEDPVASFDCRVISGCCDDSYSTTPDQDNLFGFNDATTSMLSHANYDVNSTIIMSNLNIEGESKSKEDDQSYSKKYSKGDRSRALVSEQKRRSKMKGKLYQLRALVPNITKMDKASIVGDAVLYVQELQLKAKKLKAEIASLEASSGSATTENWKESISNPMKTHVRTGNKLIYNKIIMQMDVLQVEERGFYLKLVSNKGEGVAVSLYKALESLMIFNVQNSNLVTESERLVLMLTLKVKENEQSMHLSNLKLWVTSALLNQGFEVLTHLSQEFRM